MLVTRIIFKIIVLEKSSWLFDVVFHQPEKKLIRSVYQIQMLWFTYDSFVTVILQSSGGHKFTPVIIVELIFFCLDKLRLLSVQI